MRLRKSRLETHRGAVIDEDFFRTVRVCCIEQNSVTRLKASRFARDVGNRYSDWTSKGRDAPDQAINALRCPGKLPKPHIGWRRRAFGLKALFHRHQPDEIVAQ